MTAEVIEGEVSARGRKVAIVAARFNDLVVASLVKGATAAWAAHGGEPQDLTIVRVPGAFELPLAARKLAAGGRYQAVVALGCVIRGDTPHFEYVAGEAARGLQQVNLDTGVPVAFGVLTVDSLEQALERAATGAGNKGGEAMESALEMAAVLERLE
ncbi:MAG TPA: 6,7-dimethyl-8-ribityllumazine synthase [Steroidobacteraceae bacterium]|nr:6,7-dimethyl-8-ribityllumazine synthase [Steroidobacteraceae bacterium]